MNAMKSTVLSAAGLILALGLTAAQAQAPGGEPSPGEPPAAATGGGGPSGGAGSSATESRPGAEPGKAAGQTEHMEDKSGSPGKAAKEETTKTGKDDKATTRTEDKETTKSGKDDATAKTKDNATTRTDDKGTAKTGKDDATAETKDKATTRTEDKAGTSAEGKTATEGKTRTEDKAGTAAEGGTAGEGKAGKSARLEPQQTSKAKSYFSQHRPTVKSIDRTEVSVSIGLAIPGAIALYDLPPDIIVVEGGCPIQYFVWDDDVVLVDSCTREVVEIIIGVG